MDTEAVRDELAGIDLAETGRIVAAMAAETHTVARAVDAAVPAVAAAVDAIVPRLRDGGRLVYAGAGTAGRIGVLDASECGPTFSLAPGAVVGLIAGGPAALADGREADEDDPHGAVPALDALSLSTRDCVVGVSASGRTPYPIGALRHARSLGAVTVAVTANRDTPLSAVADLAIEIPTGGEFIAGSTRLKAGTAQKVVLNMISTAVMIRLGRTYGNLMIDVRANSAKLRDRAHRIVRVLTGCPAASVEEALARADGEAKTAALMLLAGIDAERARAELAAAGGRLRAALRG